MKKYLIYFFFAITFQNLYSRQDVITGSINPDSLQIDDIHDFPKDKDYYLWYYYDTLKYNPLFMPLIFDGKWQRDTISIKPDTDKINEIFFGLKNPFQSLYENHSWKSSEISEYIHQSIKNYVYIHHPHLVKYNQSTLPNVVVEQKAIKRGQLRDLFRPESEDIYFSVDNHQRAIPKEILWWKNGNHTLNLTQNYVSENWSKGGESNIALLSIQNIKFGYNDKKKLQYETEFECKFSFYSSPNDTVRAFRVIDDATFLKSKLGYRAVEKFYYTFSVDFKTQLFNNYKANNHTKSSSFMSPADLYLGIGLDYKLKNEKVNLSVMLMPMSYRLIYIKDAEVDGVKFGLKPDTKTQHSFGSKLSGNLTWVFNKQINWVSRLYYFTDYKKTEAEWENMVNFVLNRYISTKFMFHLRYDDSVAPDSDLKYFQMKEMFSFGLSYKW